MPIVKINWFEHPMITRVDDFVKKWFDEKCISGYHDATSKNAYSIRDYRHNALRWIEEQKEMLDELEEKVKTLPFNSREMMKVSEDILED